MEWPVTQHAGPLGTRQQIMYHSPGCPTVFFWAESFLPMQQKVLQPSQCQSAVVWS